MWKGIRQHLLLLPLFRKAPSMHLGQFTLASTSANYTVEGYRNLAAHKHYYHTQLRFIQVCGPMQSRFCILSYWSTTSGLVFSTPPKPTSHYNHHCHHHFHPTSITSSFHPTIELHPTKIFQFSWYFREFLSGSSIYLAGRVDWNFLVGKFTHAYPIIFNLKFVNWFFLSAIRFLFNRRSSCGSSSFNTLALFELTNEGKPFIHINLSKEVHTDLGVLIPSCLISLVFIALQAPGLLFENVSHSFLLLLTRQNSH